MKILHNKKLLIFANFLPLALWTVFSFVSIDICHIVHTHCNKILSSLYYLQYIILLVCIIQTDTQIFINGKIFHEEIRVSCPKFNRKMRALMARKWYICMLLPSILATEKTWNAFPRTRGAWNYFKEVSGVWIAGTNDIYHTLRTILME